MVQLQQARSLNISWVLNYQKISGEFFSIPAELRRKKRAMKYRKNLYEENFKAAPLADQKENARIQMSRQRSK